MSKLDVFVSNVKPDICAVGTCTDITTLPVLDIFIPVFPFATKDISLLFVVPKNIGPVCPPINIPLVTAGPVDPCGPVAPVIPIAPVIPVGPVGPVSPEVP
jgi:hypothetical protein